MGNEQERDDVVARLEAKVAELSAEVAEMKAAGTATAAAAPATAGPAVIDTTGTLDRVTDRRQMLKRAGVAAAGAAVGGAVLATQTGIASAANGDAVLIGHNGATTNLGSTTTELRSSGHAGTMGLFVVQDGTTSITLFPSAIQGIASGGNVTHGIYGFSSQTNGYGVVAVADDAAGLFASGDRADIALGGLGAAPYSTSIAHSDGDILEDVNGDLWACAVAGTPGTWRKLAGPATAGSLHMLATPTRVYDSRPGNPPAIGLKTPLANGATRVIDTKANSSGVPAHSTAVLANFTVVNTSANGFLAAYKTGISFPGTSTINWYLPGTIVANTTVVAVDASQQLTCLVPANSSTDFFVDIIGYYL